LCAATVAQHVPYVVERADLDTRTRTNSLVTGPENIRYYIGIPLRIADQNVGTLCVLDRVARHADEHAVASLAALAHLATDRLERYATHQ
jgi:GAF domain-containing protein